MSLFNFLDYRYFLRSYIENLPRKGRGEINRLAEAAGIHPSLVSQILADEKNLSLEQAQLIASYMDLTTLETEYFLNLVLYQRAGTVKLKNYFKEKLFTMKETSLDLSKKLTQDKQLTEVEKSILYSHWLYLAIWLFTSIDKGKSLEEVSNRFRINREKALDILNFLISKNLCSKEKDLYCMSSQSVHIERSSPHLYKHHTNWRIQAIEASDKIENEELTYTAPMSISKSDFKKIREKLSDVIKEVTDTAIQSKAEEVVYFGIDFFWIKK